MAEVRQTYIMIKPDGVQQKEHMVLALLLHRKINDKKYIILIIESMN